MEEHILNRAWGKQATQVSPGSVVSLPRGWSIRPGSATVWLGKIPDREKFLAGENDRFRQFIER